MDMQEQDFRWFHGLQPLSPIFFNVHNAWMILGILKDQIDDHWLTLWIFFGHEGKFIYLLCLSMLKDYEFVRLTSKLLF